MWKLSVFAAPVALVVFVFAGRAPAAAPGEFATVNLGYQVVDWFPVDIDGDSLWELAVQIDLPAPHLGVFDPKYQRWVDGPRMIVAEPSAWGVADDDSDGTLEYFYRSGDDIHLVDPNAGEDAVLWVVPFSGGGQTVFWGMTAEGDALVAIWEEVSLSAPYYDGEDWEHYWRVHLLRARDGTEAAVTSGGPSAARFLYGFPESTSTALALEVTRESGHTGLLSTTSLHETIRLHNPDWTVADSVIAVSYYEAGSQPLPYYRIQSWAFGASENRSKFHFLAGFHPLGWPTEPFLEGWPAWSRLETDSVGDWDVDFSVADAYDAAAVFDLENQDAPDWLLVLPGDGGWERRDLATGTVTDTLTGMPNADLRTGALLIPGKPDLFYVSGSSLYVWIPDTYSDVRDDDGADAAPSPFTVTAVPNPFNSAVTLSWPTGALVRSLEICNILGQSIRRYDLVGRDAASQVTWDGRDTGGRGVASGVYFARLAAGHDVATVKIVLLR